MSIRYGFFNSIDGDRTYNAESFCDYLGSIICDGIQDTYGHQFAMSVSGTTVIVDAGKAWIQGHYIINDENITIQLSGYLGYDVYIYIFCNTSETVRRCGISYGTAVPSGDGLSTLTIGKASVGSDGTIVLTDYRGTDACPWMRCVLGKCAVTTVVDAVSELQSTVSTLQDNISTLQDNIPTLQQTVEENTAAIESLTEQLYAIGLRLDEMEETVSDLKDDTIIYTEPSGGNVTAIAYGNGDIYINGSGSATTPFSATLTQRVRDVYTASSVWSVSDGVTGLCDGYMVQLGMIAATTSEIPLLRLPVTMTEIGDNALPSWNISFAGTMDQWRAIKSYGTENTITNAIVTSTMRSLISVGCTDGKLSWDSDTSTWEEVSA